MRWLKDLGSKRFPEIAVTAVGFLAALLINSAIERHTAWHTYRSTLASLQAEAKSNRDVLDASFGKFGKAGLIFRRFDLDVGSDALRQVSVVSHATEEQTARIYHYLRDLRLANRYADELALAASAAPAEPRRQWEPSLRAALSSHLDSCAKSIDAVTNLSAD
jgi:hypothetical protein